MMTRQPSPNEYFDDDWLDMIQGLGEQMRSQNIPFDDESDNERVLKLVYDRSSDTKNTISDVFKELEIVAEDKAPSFYSRSNAPRQIRFYASGTLSNPLNPKYGNDFYTSGKTMDDVIRSINDELKKYK